VPLPDERLILVLSEGEKAMWKKKTIGAALACALAMGAWSGSALATPVNVGGVMIDPNSPFDLTVDAVNFRETSVGAVNDVLTGYGRIASINFTDPTVFCPGCDLTFTFQYTVSDISGTATNPQVVFDMGTINFYVNTPAAYNPLDPNSASSGSLWLTLTGHTAPNTDFTAVGQLYSNINGPVSNPGSSSSGTGLLNATGGLAAYFMDTNGQADGADFAFTSGFNFFPASTCSGISPNPADICHYPITGTGQLVGKSISVPEPGTIGMLGLGLGFLGLALTRRRKESDDRA
jgi:hypothetical protein